MRKSDSTRADNDKDN